MTDDDAGPTYLPGRLLVATPTTGDVFARSVVLLLHHDDDGAHGLILNKPLDVPVSAALPDWQPHVSEPSVLYQGGPVGLDTAMGLVSVPGDEQADRLGISLLFGGLGLVDLDAPPPLVMPDIAGMRVFVGYAGWEGGQLEDELEQHAWHVVDVEGGDPFTATPETLWRDVLARQRNSLAMLVTHTNHPEQN